MDRHMADTVLYDVTDGLATITLNRPDAMNAMNTAAKVALRDALRDGRGRPRRARRPAHRHRARLLRRPGPQGAHRRALRGPRVGRRQRAEHRREHYNPIVARPHRDAEAGRRRGQRGRRRGGLRLRARRRLPGRRRHRRLQHLLRGGRADRRLRRLLDAAAADRPRAAPPTCCSSRASISAQEAYELGIANKVVPAADLAAEAARGGPRPRRGADGGLRGAEGVPGVRRRRTRSPRRWRRRTNSRRGRARRRTTRSRSRRSSPRSSRSYLGR